MRQAPRSPLSFKLQRVANVPEHPLPSTRIVSALTLGLLPPVTKRNIYGFSVVAVIYGRTDRFAPISVTERRSHHGDQSCLTRHAVPDTRYDWAHCYCARC